MFVKIVTFHIKNVKYKSCIDCLTKSATKVAEICNKSTTAPKEDILEKINKDKICMRISANL